MEERECDKERKGKREEKNLEQQDVKRKRKIVKSVQIVLYSCNAFCQVGGLFYITRSLLPGFALAAPGPVLYNTLFVNLRRGLFL